MNRIKLTKEPEKILPVLFIFEAVTLFCVLQNLFKGQVTVQSVVLPGITENFLIVPVVHIILMIFILKGKERKRKAYRMLMIYTVLILLATLSCAKWYGSVGINGLLKSFLVFVPLYSFVYKAYKKVVFIKNEKCSIKELLHSILLIFIGCSLQYMFSYVIVHFDL